MKRGLFFLLVISTTCFSQEILRTSIKAPVTWHYSGKINNKYSIEMKLVYGQPAFSGIYRYASQQTYLSLVQVSYSGDGKLTLNEQADGKITGTFDGQLGQGVYTGVWTSGDGKKSFPFALTTDTQPTTFTSLISYILTPDSVRTIQDVILTSDKTSFTQRLTISKENMFRETLTEAVSFEDFNFDGYPDLQIVVDDIARNPSYQCWLYNPTSKSFVENEQLEALSAFDVNSFSKELTNFIADGCCWNETAKYQYAGGKYFKVYSLIATPEKTTIKKWVVENGVAVERE